MSKKFARPVIDWTQAPEWARHVALDPDGYWYWYANDPVPWMVPGQDRWRWVGDREQAIEEPSAGTGPMIYWFESIQDRPYGGPMSKHGRPLDRRTTSFRVSEYTMAQINALGERMQSSNTEVLILAIDRMYAQEFGDTTPFAEEEVSNHE